jgi:antitoxin MazE
MRPLTRGAWLVYIHCMNSQDAYPLPPGARASEGDFVRLASSTWEQLVFQDARVFKAGNSLAIRIPSAIAKSIGLVDGSPVDMAVESGTIWVKRAAPRRLHDLVERISNDNRHDEEFSDLTERERW